MASELESDLRDTADWGRKSLVDFNPEKTQFHLASELESDLRDTADWGRKSLVDFNPEKTQLVSFDQSKNTGTIDVKIDGSVLEEKHLLTRWGDFLF